LKKLSRYPPVNLLGDSLDPILMVRFLEEWL